MMNRDDGQVEGSSKRGRKGLICAIMLSVLAWACGSETSDADATKADGGGTASGGATASGGTDSGNGTASGGTESAREPNVSDSDATTSSPAQGRAHYHAKAPLDGGQCTVTSDSWGGVGAQQPLTPGGPVGVPELPAGNRMPTDPGGPVVDGQEIPDADGQYEVSCRVAEHDSGFVVEAALRGLNTSEYLSAGSRGSTSVTLSSGRIDTATGSGTGEVSFFTVGAGDVTSAAPCELQVVPAPDNETATIQAGRMWIIFSCPDAKTSLDDFSTCTASGTIVVENCATK